MNAKQKIFRVRRNYNQWVNNQTLEDYALRFTAKSARKWSLSRVANTALGAISFLALEAIGGAITISYGFDNAAVAILVVGLLIFLAGIPICYYAAKYGVDIDLLTRGAGFGYIGSTATSLIYASFTFIFFALEAAIMAMALKLLFGLPLSIGYIVCSVIVIPLVTHGITFISRFQLWTQPVWVILQLLPFVYLLFYDDGLIEGWSDFSGIEQDKSGSASLIYFGASTAVLFSLVAQIGEQVDFLRFLPEKNSNNRARWWLALLSAGPGWIVIGVIKIFAGSLLAYIAFSNGASEKDASDPSIMYLAGFENIIGNPQAALLISGIFVVLSQLKINVTNAYAGSIAWSNFFSRLTHSHPGRVFWVVFNVLIALVLMEIGVYQAFEQTLGAYAIIAVSWVSSLVADLVINKPLKLSPKHIEFRRAYLHDINPVGVGSMLISSIIGIVCYVGFWGEETKALAHFMTIISAFILAPAIAWITKGEFYLARKSDDALFTKDHVECCICQNHYEREDVAYCPAYTGAICSLCCSLDARCQDMCKTTKKLPDRIASFIKNLLPSTIGTPLTLRLVRFTLLLTLISGIIGALLALSYVNAETDDNDINAILSSLLWSVFLVLIIVCGIISWLFVLANESRLVAQEESQKQNLLLVQEINAHEETDKKLQDAKEMAEAANNAKSRYLTGISHELRTPLNSILGYAQLLEADDQLSTGRREKVSIMRRSGEYLADLIEGLLNISQIEAGKLYINRNQVNINSLLDQIVYMFHLQAKEKGLTFTYECFNVLPEFVTTDEKRLRQILINLLSNAIKFTHSGEVSLTVTYKNQVAIFNITDSGPGIATKDIERIFKPFERVHVQDKPITPGTGLGLTITKLLTEIMGGEIRVRDNPKGGTIFTVSLMLSDIVYPKAETVVHRKIKGYDGDKKTVMIVDDDPTHRNLVDDILTPLGFNVIHARSGEECIALHQKGMSLDLYLLDISMPDMNGWKVADTLRQEGFGQPIIIVSANANESSENNLYPNLVNDHLFKPINIDSLLEKVGQWLTLEWHYELVEGLHPKSLKRMTKPSQKNASLPMSKQTTENNHGLSQAVLDHIIELAEIGHLTELKRYFDQLEQQNLITHDLSSQCKTWLKEVRFDKLLAFLRNTKNV